MPKFYLLYYKTIVDIALLNFFNKYNSQFVKIDCNYVLANHKLIDQFKNELMTTVTCELKKFVEKYDALNPKYYFIIGSCNPIDNILLKYKEQKYFPAKLEKTIVEKQNIKYLLKEKDIDIDIISINACIEAVFNKLFSKSINKNVIFIKNNVFDCYTMFKVLKSILGNSNCINIHKEMYANMKSPLYAINDMINYYIHDKRKLNKDKQFIENTLEIKQFINQKVFNKIDAL